MARFGLIFLLASFALPNTSHADARKAVWTAKQLRTKIQQTQDRIESVYVAYRSSVYPDPEFPTGTYVRRVLAAKAPHNLYHLSCHGSARLDWEDDPYLQVTYVGVRAAYTYFPFENAYFVSSVPPNSALPGTLGKEFFFRATGVWPLVQKVPPRENGQPVVLRDIAASSNYSEVGLRQELVAGRWCHVLAFPSVDYLWLDVQRGCAIVARERFAPATDVRVERYEMTGHVEAAEGIWLPSQLRNIQFDFTALTEAGRQRRVIDAVMTVEEVAVNSVRDDVFLFDPPPGSLLLHNELYPEYQYPMQVKAGGIEWLDHLVHWGQRYAPQKDEPRSLLTYGAYACLSLLLVILLALEIQRRANDRVR